MNLDRNDLVAAELLSKLRLARIGVIVQRVDAIDVASILEIVSQELQLPLHVAVVGYSVDFAGSNVPVSTKIEDAVAWRNSPELAGRIVVFIKDDVTKLHSLGDLDTLSRRELIYRLLGEASEELASNQPQQRFWKSLQQDATNHSLAKIEEFVRQIAIERANANAIPANLWRLGLLQDDDILMANREPLQRLRYNRELLTEIEQLSTKSRKRLSAALARLNVDSSGLQSAYSDLMDFHRRNNINALKRLTVPLVEELIKKSLPSFESTQPQNESQDQEEPQLEGDFESIIEQPSSSLLSGRQLREAVAQFAVRSDKESQERLSELSDSLQQYYESPQEFEDELILGEQEIRIDTSTNYLHDFVGFVCNSECWGGVLKTSGNSIEDAIRRYSPDDFLPYHPETPAQDAGGHSLFSLLRRFDQFLEPNQLFTDAISRFVAARTMLAEYVDLLLEFPFVILGGKPDIRRTVEEYVRAYADILRYHRYYQAELHHHDPISLRFIATEILRLDVVHIRTPSEGKALITPLHPFYLWRLYEILRHIHAENRILSEEEQAQLAGALVDLPHALHFLVTSPDVPGFDDSPPLPQSGNLGLLPTFENRTNRYLGADGTEIIGDLLERWWNEVPYSRSQIRLALVDIPDIRAALIAATHLLKSAHSTSIFVDVYFTRGQNMRGKLAQIDFSGKDHDLANFIHSERIVVNLCPVPSLHRVVDSLLERPVHITCIFDQSEYSLATVPRARHLIVSPLVITYQYSYSPLMKRGSIEPSKEAEEGIFADYHFLVQTATRLHPGEQLRLQSGGNVEMEPINTLLKNGATRWLAIADRELTDYSPEAAIPLRESKMGQREVAVWTASSSRTIRDVMDFLRQYSLQPERNRVEEILYQFGHIAAAEWLTSPKLGISIEARERRQKGLYGTLLAAAWYIQRHPGALITSLDSEVARYWLQQRPGGNKRADLIGVRVDQERNTVIIEPIEVKTQANESEVRIIREQGVRGWRIIGRAVTQLQSMIEVLGSIFGNLDAQPLFTPARREALKYQLHRECYRKLHTPEWQEKWYSRLSQIFALTKSGLSIECSGLIIHIQLEENSNEQYFIDSEQPIRLAKIGAKAIQAVISITPSAHQEESIPYTQVGSTLKPETLPANSIELASELPEQKEIASQTDSPSNMILSIAEETSSHSFLQPSYLQLTLESVQEGYSGASPVPNPTIDRAEIEELARLFRRACQAYRIQLDSCDASQAIAGPNVWRLYIRLSRGQRLDPLRNALEDIGREMRRSGILIASIPNSDQIAIDIPRMNRSPIPISRAVQLLPTVTSPEQLPIPIGVTPEGEDLIRDLAAMPHLLVGGTTGAGKTVFLYGLLHSMLLTHPSPESLRLLVSTSKPEDFVFFQGLQHLETGTVIANAEEAVRVMQRYLTDAFDERLNILTSARCRDITEYNQNNSPSLAPLVIIVDEFADLADQLALDRTTQRAFYTNLRRVAQLGRSRGMHLILCTQRPSADLVPTNIRALMNVRVGLRVNDVDSSRMILNDSGAEQLQLHGDLLFKEQSSVTRAQGYYVHRDDLIELFTTLRGNQV